MLVIKYWFNQINYDGPGADPAIYVAITLIAIIAINYFGVGFFGEFEFWLSSAKVLIMLGLILFTLVLATTSQPGQPAPGFKYWVHPGAFAPYMIGKFILPSISMPSTDPLTRWQRWQISRLLERPQKRRLLFPRC